MHIPPLIKALLVFRGLFKQLQGRQPAPRSGGNWSLIVAGSTAIVVVLSFVTGKVPIPLGQYHLLIGQALVGALLATIFIAEGTGRSFGRTAVGFAALSLAIYSAVSIPGMFLSNAPGTFLGQKVAGVCQKATDLWEDRPTLPPPPDLNEIRERAGEIGTDIQGELEERKPQGLPFWGQTPTPTAVPSPTPVPTSTPTFLEGIIPGD